MSNLPDTWAALPLGDVIQTQKGKKPTNLGEKDGERNVPYINIAAFETKRIAKYAPEQDIPRCETADTLLVWDGARAGLSGRGISGYIGSTLARVTSALTDPGYLFHFINSKYKTLNTQTKGVGIPHIDPAVLRSLEFPLAPLTEQARIVEKLEELFSDIDAGVVDLKAAQAKLVQYSQSLLKAAMDGGLTAAWRAERTKRSEPPETGEQLLERILIERRRRWESKQLANYERYCKTPPKAWQERYSEPIKPNTTDLSELPEGWTWASVDQLTSLITSGSRGWARYYSTQGAVFIRSQDINTDMLDLMATAHVEIPEDIEGARTRVEKNDVLLTITGANVGKCAHVDIDLDNAYVSQHVALIRAVDAALGPYLHLYLTCIAGGRGQLNKVAYGAGKPGLNLQQVASVAVPVPGAEEITKVLTDLAKANSSLDQQKTKIVDSLRQSSAQRQSIIKAAFSGQLVPQEPNDEPARNLLERIRKVHAEQTKQPKSRKSKQAKKEIGDFMKNLINVLMVADGWLAADEAFRRCGVADGTETEHIEKLYAELRELDHAKRLQVRRIGQFDELRLKD